jgi:hypothetical protein
MPLCCTIPSGHPARLLTGTVLYGVRTFLDQTICLAAIAQPTWPSDPNIPLGQRQERPRCCVHRLKPAGMSNLKLLAKNK